VRAADAQHGTQTVDPATECWSYWPLSHVLWHSHCSSSTTHVGTCPDGHEMVGALAQRL
jgi:hypothetical protein